MKRILALSLVVLTLLSLCACGKKQTAFKPRLDTQQTATLNIAGFMGNFEALDQAINAFAELYPNVTILYDHNTIFLLPEYLRNNENTDIFMTDDRNVNRPDLPDTDAMEWCLDLSQEDMDMSAVLPEALKGCTVDGKLVRLPLAMNPCGVVVNETLLKNEGLTVPTNYQEMLSCMQALKEEGYIPLQGSEQHLYGELMLNMAMNVLAADSEAVEALRSGKAGAGNVMLPVFQRLEEIVSNGYTDYEQNCTYPADNYDGSILNFFEGNVPFYVCTSECVSGMKKRETKSETFAANPFTYSFVYPPVGDTGAYAYNESWYGFSVNKNSDNKDLAVEFLRFLMTPQWLSSMASIKGMPSVAVNDADARYQGLYKAKNIQASFVNDGSIPGFIRLAFTKTCNEYGAGLYQTPEEAAEAFAGYCANPVSE